jgi:hypothetical protein
MLAVGLAPVDAPSISTPTTSVFRAAVKRVVCLTFGSLRPRNQRIPWDKIEYKNLSTVGGGRRGVAKR